MVYVPLLLIQKLIWLLWKVLVVRQTFIKYLKALVIGVAASIIGGICRGVGVDVL